MSKNTILTFFQSVAKQRFKDDNRKSTEVFDLGDRINMHCPFCGDSHKANGKPRGWIRKATKRYTCYNDGCNARYMTLEQCIITLSQKFNVSIDGINFDDLKPSESDVERLASRKKFKASTKTSTSHNPFREFLMDVGILDVLPTISQFKLLMNLRSLNEIELYSTLTDCANDNVKYYSYSDNVEFPILNYLISERCIDKSPTANKMVFLNASFDKIFLINYDIESGRVLSFATRTFPEKNYKVFTFDDMKRIFRYDESVIAEYQALFIDICGLFNVLNVDFSRRVRVVEGQFDSMFVENGFSLNSVNNIWLLKLYFEDKNLVAYFDNDVAGAKGSLSMDIKKFFMWSKFKAHLIEGHYKYIDEIKHKIKDVNDAFRFYCKITGGAGNIDEFDAEISKFESDCLIDKFYL